VAASFEAWLGDCLLAGVAGSNPTGGMDICLLKVLCVRGLRGGPIHRPEKSFRLRARVCVCVCVCVIECYQVQRTAIILHTYSDQVKEIRLRKKERKKERKKDKIN
jgi:hypothetical protein